MSVLASYATIVGVIRTVLLYGAGVVAVICGFDWAVRTRRISPFSKTARIFRGRVDPLVAPIERVVVRAGGTPAAAPWWALVAVVVGGIALLGLLDLLADILFQVVVIGQQPSQAPRILLSWGFSVLRLALLVRVLSSWLPISPYSKWIRWSYALTDWMIIPLRRLIPSIGMIDITPIVAWFGLSLLQRLLGIA
ncbi:MAG TPA: YggT family protein [Gemmatimonadaceae bacterium]|jgi:YggT family protein|nr:YggT family protein [Gemmatimonadaceae bacterium]